MMITKKEYEALRKKVLLKIKPDTILREKVATQIKYWNEQQSKVTFLLGGSLAKGTHLKNVSDVDVFCVFADKNEQLSSQLKLVLQDLAIDAKTVHGSRDYFQAKMQGLDWEFIPVLYIASAKQAKNVTDVSPLHLQWFLNNSTPKLCDEVRIAKQFFKAQRLYGAESYISGFSGHVVDILVAHYGSFSACIQAIANWETKHALDPANHYYSEKKMRSAINQAKKEGPLLLIDPVDKQRNAAASLSRETYTKAIACAKQFVQQPNEKAFVIKPFSPTAIAAKNKKLHHTLISCFIDESKTDIAGACAKKFFEKTVTQLKKEGFDVQVNTWFFDAKKHTALCVIGTTNARLSVDKVYVGPTLDRKNDVKRFKNIHRLENIYDDGKKVFASKKRNYTGIIAHTKQFATELKSDRFSKVKRLIVKTL